MNNIRRKAEVPEALNSLSPAEHAYIAAQGAQDSKYWNVDNRHPDYGVVTKYRAEVKEHYYHRQARRCCYCSKELDSHKATYDAEHVLDKHSNPHLMFAVSNVAASCRRCNNRKKTKEVLSTPGKPALVPPASADYLILHPHLDEWDHHLSFDKFGRIVPLAGANKGKDTIAICGIEGLNSARLSDHFLPGDSRQAEKTLESFFNVTSIGWKKKKLAILEKMVQDHKLGYAKEILDFLQDEIDNASAVKAKNGKKAMP